MQREPSIVQIYDALDEVIGRAEDGLAIPGQRRQVSRTGLT